MDNKKQVLDLFFGQCQQVNLNKLQPIKGFVRVIDTSQDLCANEKNPFTFSAPDSEKNSEQWKMFVASVSEAMKFSSNKKNEKPLNFDDKLQDCINKLKKVQKEEGKNELIRKLMEEILAAPAVLSYQPLLVLLTAECKDTSRRIPLMTIPAKVDGIDLTSGEQTFYLRPNIEQLPVVNPQILRQDENIKPNDIELGHFDDFMTALTSFSNGSNSKTDDWNVWIEGALKILEIATDSILETLPIKIGFKDNKLSQNWQITASLAKPNSDDSAIRNNLELYSFVSEAFKDIQKAFPSNPLFRTLKAFCGEEIHTRTHPHHFLYKRLQEFSSDYLLGHMDETKISSSADWSERELFPLDNTQRQVTSLFNDCNDGDILAVNGPPGSGKTAMLRAVIAHQWVKAAIESKPCPITFAIGATNQSVENVISAFPKVLNNDYQNNNSAVALVTRRWLGEGLPSSYGTYFPAKGRIEGLLKQADLQKVIGEASKDNELTVFKWSGDNINKLSDIENLQNMQNFYLSQAKAYFRVTNINVVGESLNGDLSTQIRNCAQLLQKELKKLHKEFMAARIKFTDNNVKFVNQRLAELEENPTLSVPQSKEPLKWMQTILANPLSAEGIKHINQVMRERLRDEGLEDLCENREKILQNKGYIEDALFTLFERWLDTHYRAKLFHITARYWEAKYLLEVDAEILIRKDEQNIEKALRRMCMVTPCLVSTINTIPSIFQVPTAAQQGMDFPFALNSIDLLIMDETGQAQQRLALPILALAKKILAVGDVLQLQPVVPDDNLSVADEHLSFIKHAVGQLFVSAVKNKVTTKSGSMLHLMLLAASDGILPANVKSKEALERGVLLRGHYRCKTNIIQFCNEAVYDNKLFYHPKDNKDKEGLPSFAWLNSSSPCTRVNGSWVNEEEANRILTFIEGEWEEYKKKYDNAELKVSDLIAIVTPFKEQANKLKKIIGNKIKGNETTIFQQQDIGDPDEKIAGKMIIGTVDSLQGAEKPIIIFSGVKGIIDGELHFKDEPFLLNVAVSRAKDSFIAFICEKSYGVNTTAPNQDELDMWRGKSEGGSAFHKYLGYYLSHAKYSDSERKGQPRCINLQPQEKTLVLIEAGGKKDTLSEIMTEIMGPDFHIEVSGGAITQLALDDKSLSFKDLKPHYQLTDSGESFINRIVETYGDYDRICLATDDDNVGECIAWHIYHQVLMRLPDNEAKETFCKRVERVKLRAISKDKVEEAFKSASKKEPYDKARVASEILREITDNIMARKLGELLNDPQISLESKNQSLMQSLLGANVIKENGSNTSFQGLGRVKLGILALLVENAQHKLNSQMIFGKPQQIIPKVTMPDGQLIPLTFMDNNQDKDKDNQKYKSTTQAIFENMKDNRVPGTLSKWEPVLIEPAAHNQISTLDVLAKAAQECGMRPSVVMNALQRLYEGKV